MNLKRIQFQQQRLPIVQYAHTTKCTSQCHRLFLPSKDWSFYYFIIRLCENDDFVNNSTLSRSLSKCISKHRLSVLQLNQSFNGSIRHLLSIAVGIRAIYLFIYLSWLQSALLTMSIVISFHKSCCYHDRQFKHCLGWWTEW